MNMALRSAHSMGLGLVATSVAHRLNQVFTVIVQWHERAASRRALARLDDRMLHDIAASSVDVEREICKPFWRT